MKARVIEKNKTVIVEGKKINSFLLKKLQILADQKGYEIVFRIKA